MLWFYRLRFVHTDNYGKLNTTQKTWLFSVRIRLALGFLLFLGSFQYLVSPQSVKYFPHQKILEQGRKTF